MISPPRPDILVSPTARPLMSRKVLTVSPFRVLRDLAASVWLLGIVWIHPSHALDLLKVQMAFYPQGPQAYMYLALAKGWYRDAGLDVQLLQGRGSNYSVQMLSVDHADIGEGELVPLVFARTRGASIKIIAEWYPNDGPAVIVPIDSPIKNLRDLKNKKIILTAAGPWPPLLDSFLGEFNLTQSDVSLVYVNSSALFTSYAVGQGDALMSVGLAFTEANPVRPSRMFNALDYGVKIPGNGIYVSDQTLATKPDVLARFVSVSARALDYIYDGHVSEAANAIATSAPDAKLGVEILQQQIELFADARFLPSTRGRPIGWQSPEEWQERISYLEKARLLEHGHAAGEFFTNDIINAIQRRGGG